MAFRSYANRQKPWLIRKYKGAGYIDTSKAPKWWISQPDKIEKYLRSLKGVEVFEIGRSAGGRPIIAAAYGKKEPLPGRTCTSLASAVAGGSTEAFYGKGKRERQSFVFVGAAHGMEIEGTVAALNFLNVVVTGKDLRGRAWPKMAEEGRKLRIVIIPVFNMDGRERMHDSLHMIGIHPEAGREIGQGHFKNGEKLSWPKSKLYYPIPVDEVAFLGTYFNDNGANLVYDFGMAGSECQPETRALGRFVSDELPDCVVCSHSDNGSLAQPPDSFVPAHYRQRQLQLGAILGSRPKYEGMKKWSVTQRVETYAGQQFYQTDMIYHMSGALPLLIEFPCGYQNYPDNHAEILDIGMVVLEEIVKFGTYFGFKPRDTRW